MKASKFSDAQNAFIIKQGEEGKPVAEIFRMSGLTQQRYQTRHRVFVCYGFVIPFFLIRLHRFPGVVL
jgi:hypothetical protein